MRRKISAKVKAAIALEALQGEHTTAEIAGKYGV
jgi:transposase-like protein